MKKTLSTAVIALSLAILPLSVSAQTLTTPEMMKEKKEYRKEMVDKIKARKHYERVFSGKITSINGTSLTVTAKKGVYTVDASNAKLVRRFGSKVVLADFKVADDIMVNGTVTTSTGTIVTAKMIRNNSLHLRNATVRGTVSGLSSGGFTLLMKEGVMRTINLSASTTYMKDGKVASLTDINASSSVIVYGNFDRKDGPITAKKIRIISPASTSTTAR